MKNDEGENLKLSTTTVGEMRKRREMMADNRRYIIYYTFTTAEDDSALPSADAAAEPQTSLEKSEESENV